MFPKNRVLFEREVSVSNGIGEVPTVSFEVVLDTQLRVCEGSGTLGTASSAIFTDLGLEINRSYLVYTLNCQPKIKIGDKVTIFDFNSKNINGYVKVIRHTRIRNKNQEVFISVN